MPGQIVEVRDNGMVIHHANGKKAAQAVDRMKPFYRISSFT